MIWGIIVIAISLATIIKLRWVWNHKDLSPMKVDEKSNSPE